MCCIWSKTLFFSVSCSLKETGVNGKPLEMDTNCFFKNNWWFGPTYVLVYFVVIMSAVVCLSSLMFHGCLFASKRFQAKYISSKYCTIYYIVLYCVVQSWSNVSFFLIGVSNQSQQDVRNLVKKLRRSDFVLLYLISRNVSTKKFTRFLGRLNRALPTTEIQV